MAADSVAIIADFLEQSYYWLRDIPPNAIDDCFATHFLDYENDGPKVPKPAEFDPPLDQRELKELFEKALIRFANYFSDPAEDEKLLEELQRRKFKAKALCAVLWCCMEEAVKPSRTVEDMLLGLAAASVYLCFCCMNNFTRHDMCEPVLGELAVKVFLRAQQAYQAYSGKTGARGGGAKGSKKTGGKKGNSTREATQQSTIEDEEHSAGLSQEDMDALKGQLIECSSALHPYLRKEGLVEGAEDCLVKNLCEFLRDVLFVDMADHPVEPREFTAFQELPLMSSRSLALAVELARTERGLEYVMSRIVVPRLLYLPPECNTDAMGTTVSATMLTGRKLAVALFKTLLAQCSENPTDDRRVHLCTLAVDALRTCMYAFNDKKEIRQCVVESILDILACLSQAYVHHFLDFICYIAHSTKPAVRSMAVEVSASVLQKLDDFGQFPRLLPPFPQRTQALNETRLNETRLTHRGEEAEEQASADHSVAAAAQRRHEKKRQDAAVPDREQPLAEANVEEALLQVIATGLLDKSSVAQKSMYAITVLLRERYAQKVNAAGRPLTESLKPFVKATYEALVREADDESEEEDDDCWVATLRSPTNHALLNVLMHRCEDQQVVGRKMAVETLEVIYPRLSEPEHKEQCVHKLQEMCQDDSPMIRKQTAETLTNLLVQCFDAQVKQAWLDYVLLLVLDSQPSVVQAASELVTKTLITPIFEEDAEQVWQLLADIEYNVAPRRMLVNFLHGQFKSQTLPTNLVLTLTEKAQREEYRNAAWMLLSELSSFVEIRPDSVLRDLDELDVGSEDRVAGYQLKLLANRCDALNAGERQQLEELLRDALLHNEVEVDHIQWAYYALARLIGATGDDPPFLSNLVEFNKLLIDGRDDHTGLLKRIKLLAGVKIGEIHSSSQRSFPHSSRSSPHLRSHRSSPEDEEARENNERELHRMVETVSWCVQYTPQLLFESEQAEDGSVAAALEKTGQAEDDLNVASQKNTDEPESRPVAASKKNTGRPDCGPIVETLEILVASEYLKCRIDRNARSTPVPPAIQEEDIGAEAEEAAQEPVERPISPASSVVVCSQPERVQLSPDILTPALRSRAVIALGRILIQDETIAAKKIPVLVKQLKLNEDVNVRNNIAFVICDLCKRFTGKVNSYIGLIAMCIRDKALLVRHQTLLLLTNLVMEEFLKWRGQLMYQFLSCVLDEDKEVRAHAEFCMVQVLLKKFPDLFSENFLQCMRYFNGLPEKSDEDEQLDESALIQDEEIINRIGKCDLSGKESAGARYALYRFQLAAMSDFQKNDVTFKIAHDIFGAISSEQLDIHQHEVQELFKDACAVLMTKEIRLALHLGRVSDDEEVPEQLQEAATKFMAIGYLQLFVTVAIPKLIQLKKFLVEHKSDLVGRVYELVVKFAKDHSTTLDVLLREDPQMKAEIELMLLKLEQKQEHEQLCREREQERQKKAQQPRRATAYLTSTPISGAVVPPMASIERILAGRTPVRRVIKQEVLVGDLNRIHGRIVLCDTGTPRTPRRSVGSQLQALATIRRHPALSRISEHEAASSRRSLPTALSSSGRNPSQGLPEEPSFPLRRRQASPEAVDSGAPLSSPSASNAKESGAPLSPSASTAKEEPMDEEPVFAVPQLPKKARAPPNRRAISTPERSMREITFNADISGIPRVTPLRRNKKRARRPPPLEPKPEPVDE